jgi:hypothetical protein
MRLGAILISWQKSFKYLGVVFKANCNLQFDCDEIKKKFYAAFNGILSGCKGAAENVKVQLITSFCLPILTYSIGAVVMSADSLKMLNTCLNDVFRKVYNMNRWESVAFVQFYSNQLPFKYMYDLCRWNFVMKCADSCIPVAYLLRVTSVEYDIVGAFNAKYNCYGKSAKSRKMAVWNMFSNVVWNKC